MWSLTESKLSGGDGRWPAQRIASVIVAAAAVVLFVIFITLIEQPRRPPYWMFAFPLGTALAASLWGALASWFSMRALALARVPLTTIANAAPGAYVRLSGRAAPPQGRPLINPYSGRPCCWYRFLLERKDDDGDYVVENSGESGAPLLLRDAGGTCVLDTQTAELAFGPPAVTYGEGFRYSETVIRVDQMLTAQGRFETRSFDEKLVENAVKELMVEWKRDLPALRKRFDVDSDGSFSGPEWAAVLQAARREVEARRLVPPPPEHHLRRPGDGRPFFISTQGTAELRGRYLNGLISHAFYFIVAGLCLAAITSHYYRIHDWI